MKLVIGFLVTLVTLGAYAQALPSIVELSESNPRAAFAGMRVPSREVFLAKKNLTTADCRANIKDVICLVSGSPDSPFRDCEQGGEAYAHFFEELYDQYPPALQRVFCSLGHLYVETQLTSIAYAGSGFGGLPILGIRKSVLDENMTLAHLISWKEQLNFGGATEGYVVAPNLPQYVIGDVEHVNALIYYVMAHEFGHILDFANDVNDGGPWGDFSWNGERPNAQNSFKNRDGLCFYSCNGRTLSPSVIPQVYDDLFNHTNFITTYATTNPYDDFAESVAFYAFDFYLKKEMALDTKQGAVHDFIAKLKGPLFKSKYDYVSGFLNRPDLIYPK